MTQLMIITGFLGSGKTTTLNYMLKHTAKEKLAVIINEFAAIGVDGKLVNSEGMEIRELNNGCVCCSKSKELEETIEVLKEKYAPDKIILETTGVATLKPIIRIAQRKGLSVTGIITVIDAYRSSKTTSFGKLSEEQIKLSSTIIVNKIEMIQKKEAEEVIRRISSINAKAQIISCTLGAVRPEQINISKDSALTFPPAKPRLAMKILTIFFPKIGLDSVSRHIANSKTGSVSFQTNGKINKRKFYDFIDLLGDDVYRAKGFINFSDSEKTVVFNYASGLLTIEEGKQSENSSVVMIGKMSIIRKVKWLLMLNKLRDKQGKTQINETLTNLKYFLRSA